MQQPQVIERQDMDKRLPLAVIIVVGSNIFFGLATVVSLIKTMAPTILEMKNFSDSNTEFVNSNIGCVVSFFIWHFLPEYF